jgi:hypothetical protein
MSKTPETRKQIIRDTVKEMLPDILEEVIKTQQYEQLKSKVEERLTHVEKYVKETADLMNVRQKETLKYLLETYLAALPKKEDAEQKQ